MNRRSFLLRSTAWSAASAAIGHAEGILLLLENEPACNVGNSAELAEFLPKVPERLLGFN